MAVMSETPEDYSNHMLVQERYKYAICFLYEHPD